MGAVSPSPIARALSTLLDNGVRFLVVGGQACILYGGAEFSRDLDLAVLVSSANLDRLRAALAALEAEPVFVPPLSAEVLEAGHACHFRCRAEGLLDVRLDVLGSMRGADPFEDLWDRRVEVEIEGGLEVPVISLPDLVRTKKTQRDKDWPMIRRLVEADIAQSDDAPAQERVAFWLRECRTPDLLVELVRAHPNVAASLAGARPLLRTARDGDAEAVARGLRAEEDEERARDRAYWEPLRRQIRAWRKEGRCRPEEP